MPLFQPAADKLVLGPAGTARSPQPWTSYLVLGVLLAVTLPGQAADTEPPSSLPASSHRPPGQKTAGQPALSLRVAAVQMRSSRNLADNVARIQKDLKQCATAGVRVAVFPECALTGYFEDKFLESIPAAQIDDALRQVAATCRQARIYAVLGTPYRAHGQLYNSAVVLSPAGKLLARYDKIQLAEKWPAGGEHLIVFKVDEVSCSILICHDERYPELVRLPVLAGARVIFYLSHESGLRAEHKLIPYRAQIQARAVENNVFVVHANAPANPDASGSHGQSRIIAPDGNLIQEASLFGEDIVTATLDVSQATAANAAGSLTRGPLRSWWSEGLKHVRLLPEK